MSRTNALLTKSFLQDKSTTYFCKMKHLQICHTNYAFYEYISNNIANNTVIKMQQMKN